VAAVSSAGGPEGRESCSRAVLRPPGPRRFAIDRDPLRREDVAALNITGDAVGRARPALQAGLQGSRDRLQKLAPPPIGDRLSQRAQ
jgi:hypothetical protein